MESNAALYQSKIELDFSEYLTTKKISEKTITNYKSDLHHFLSWFTDFCEKQQAPTTYTVAEFIKLISPAILEEYKNEQLNAQNSPSTINRRLSTLRMFFKSCIEAKLIESDPSEEIVNLNIYTFTKKESFTNLSDILNAYSLALKKDGASASTIKNYVGDVEDFLKWLTTNTPDLT
jgi:site-specific recombinase XerD